MLATPCQRRRYSGGAHLVRRRIRAHRSRRHRSGNPARAPGPHLRSVLHHQEPQRRAPGWGSRSPTASCSEHDGTIEVESQVGQRHTIPFGIPGTPAIACVRAATRSRKLASRRKRCSEASEPRNLLSSPDIGSDTTTVVAFPSQDLPADRVSPPSGRILVIDDEADIRESLELLLTTRKYARRSGRECDRGLQKVRIGQLRSGSARSDDARPLRHGGPCRYPAARSGNPDFHAHRVRLGRSCGAGSEIAAPTIISRSPGITKSC